MKPNGILHHLHDHHDQVRHDPTAKVCPLGGSFEHDGISVSFGTGIANTRKASKTSLPKGHRHVESHHLGDGGMQHTYAYDDDLTVVVIHDDPPNDLYEHPSYPDVTPEAATEQRTLTKTHPARVKGDTLVHEQCTMHVFECRTPEEFEKVLETQTPSIAIAHAQEVSQSEREKQLSDELAELKALVAQLVDKES